VGANTHTLTVSSYDADGHLVKTTQIDLDIYDAAGSVLMPSDWPQDWPTGDALYHLLEQAYYRRLHEEAPWLIGPGTVVTS
jgi:hypothetical protein